MHAYELTLSNGCKVWDTQKYKFTEQEMLDAFKTQGVVKVKYHCQVPRGYHVCGCGKLAYGTKDELCDECREIYGHHYEHEL